MLFHFLRGAWFTLQLVLKIHLREPYEDALASWYQPRRRRSLSG
jgi:hypothetical protein